MSVKPFCNWWKSVQAHAHAHHKLYHGVHHASHVSYLALVATHGAYHYAAFIMLCVIAFGFLLKLEEL